MAKKKKAARRKPRSRKKRVVRVRKVVKRARTVKRKKRTGSASIASYKAKIRKIAESDLKDGLFNRDKATTYKQHRTAQSKVDKARRVLRQTN